MRRRRQGDPAPPVAPDLRAGALDPAPVAVAALPDGRNDVGECTHEEAWAAVATALGRPLAGPGLGSASSDAG